MNLVGRLKKVFNFGSSSPSPSPKATGRAKATRRGAGNRPPVSLKPPKNAQGGFFTNGKARHGNTKININPGNGKIDGGDGNGKGKIKKYIVFHGTSRDAARNICRGHAAFFAGGGNAFGSGSYFAFDPQVAASYGPVLLKCQVRIESSRMVTYGPALRAQAGQWAMRHGFAVDSDTLSAFLLKTGRTALVVREQGFLVLPRPRLISPAAFARPDKRIKVVAVLDSATRKPVVL